MAGSDASRADLFALLEQSVGRETASALMDHIPPGGWPDFATKADIALLRSELTSELTSKSDFGSLRSEFGSLRSEFGSLKSEVAQFEERLGRRIDALDHRVELFEHRILGQVDRRLRAHTWVHTSTLIAGLALVAALGRVG